MEAVQKKVLKELYNKSNGLSLEELCEKLNCPPKVMTKTLNNLVNEMKVEKKNDRFISRISKNIKIGKLKKITDSYGFVTTEDGKEFYIENDNYNGALHEENVLFEIIREGKEQYAVVIDYKRTLPDLIGEIIQTENGKIFMPYNTKNDLAVNIGVKKIRGYKEGSIVKVKLIKEISYQLYKGEITEVLGNKIESGRDIWACMIENNWPVDYSEKYIKEIQKLPTTISELDLEGRIDFTGEKIFTIDCDATKDIDDAVGIKKLSNNNYELSVHIADVSHYVKEGTEIDKDAYKKGTSVYPANMVFPMFDEKISNNICSLSEGDNRLTLSVIMEINKLGEIVRKKITPGIIKSKKKMQYSKVNLLLNEGIISEGYEQFTDELRLMDELTDILKNKRLKNGGLDFNIPELVLDINKGLVENIHFKINDKAEKIIEESMLITNEQICNSLDKALYRVHELPKENDINNLCEVLTSFGISISLKDFETSKSINDFLNSIKDDDNAKIIMTLTIKSMAKAMYQSDNIGHFGLGKSNYLHFTSPIRRYPDLIVHRLVKQSLGIGKGTTRNLLEAGKHLSSCEKKAINCERDVLAMKLAEYMETKKGEIHDGRIVALNQTNLVVELFNGIQGMVSYNTIGGIKNYDSSLQLKTKDNVYRLGDTVAVLIKDASKIERRIDFCLVENKKYIK